MAQDDGQDRTEAATPKRIREAREKGQIPRSRELNTMAMMLAAAGVFIVMGASMIRDLIDFMGRSFTPTREHIFDIKALPSMFMDSILEVLGIITPFLAVMVVVAFFSSIAISGWNFSASALAFKWEKLDPVKGLGRIFAIRGLVELLKAAAKFLIIGTAAIVLLRSKADVFLSLGNKSIDVALADLGNLLVWSFLTVSLTLVLLAVIDVPFQIWDNAKQLKMTRQEIRDEMKQTEGNPEVKSRIRQLQREMAQRRMIEAVPKADVVITNPTHFAVAIRYDQGNMHAPVVVAKGVDNVAASIRAVAASNDVMILSAPPLARALYYSTELDQEIPVGLFQAVAQVLAYIFHLKESGSTLDNSTVLDDLPIPSELQRS